jgi:predicted flavoprotein YhiN
VRTSDGNRVDYDALLLAAGGEAMPAIDHC